MLALRKCAAILLKSLDKRNLLRTYGAPTPLQTMCYQRLAPTEPRALNSAAEDNKFLLDYHAKNKILAFYFQSTTILP